MGTHLAASSGAPDSGWGSGSVPARLQRSGATVGGARAPPLPFQLKHSLQRSMVEGAL